MSNVLFTQVNLKKMFILRRIVSIRFISLNLRRSSVDLNLF